MSESWGFEIKSIPILQRTNMRGEPHLCASGGRQRCPNQIAYFTCYRYITGRAGRMGRAQKWACADHAAKFAKKHGLAFDPQAPAPDGKATMSVAEFLETQEKTS